MKEQFKIDDFFSKRTGINIFKYYDTNIIIYEDHRTILNVLFVLFKIGKLKFDLVPNIISFDLHDDFNQGLKKSEIFNILNIKSFDNIELKDFWSFVEFDCNGLDNDWVKIAMELNMIKDYVNIGGYYIDNLKESPEYISEDNISHKLYYLKHLDFELSNTDNFIGQLVNPIERTLELRNIFGFNNFENCQNNFSDIQYPYILDFDLDCFTAPNIMLVDFSDNEPLGVPWNEKTFKNLYYGFSDNFVRDFMRCLIKRSEITTICLEPFYCGGYKESIQILEYLDKYIFEGKLQTSIEWI